MAASINLGSGASAPKPFQSSRYLRIAKSSHSRLCQDFSTGMSIAIDGLGCASASRYSGPGRDLAQTIDAGAIANTRLSFANTYALRRMSLQQTFGRWHRVQAPDRREPTNRVPGSLSHAL